MACIGCGAVAGYVLVSFGPPANFGPSGVSSAALQSRHLRLNPFGRGTYSAYRALPKFTRFDDGDAFVVANCQKVFVHSNQQLDFPGYRRAEDRNIGGVSADVIWELSGLYVCCGFRQETPQLEDIACREFELIPQFSSQLFGNKIRNDQFVMG